MGMDDALKRARAYRIRAVETRTAADARRHQINRETLRQMADDYDLMAAAIEQSAQGVRDREKSAT
jgi:hypothetical protein